MTAANAVFISDSPLGLLDLGIDTINSAKAHSYLLKSTPSVVGLSCTPDNFEKITAACVAGMKQWPNRQFFVVNLDLDPTQLCHITSFLRPRKILEIFDKKNIIEAFQNAFGDYFEIEQREKLTELINEKNEELKRLTVHLEIKVEDRQKQLEQSVIQSQNVEKRLKLLKQVLVNIFQAKSISEIEAGVFSVLRKEFCIVAVQIRQIFQSSLNHKVEKHQCRVPLRTGPREHGFVLFIGEHNKLFSKDEKKFFAQVGEAVSLSIERSFESQKSHELKKQWEATFDAISDPICLTDSQYNILRINKAFEEKKKNLQSPEIIGQKCYNVLFSRDRVCEGCQRGQSFQLKPDNISNEVYDVYSNILMESQGLSYFQMYRDITQTLNLERQVVDSAKMVELGTISSSIAHELNNPIGGMLNFLQLMKMDLQGNEDYYDDISEIEKGTQKCKQIVQNLLGFSRQSHENEFQELDLTDILNQAVNITELKTRSIGIKIIKNYGEVALPFHGKFNRLAHTLRNILQNAQESILEKRSKQKGFRGTIEVQATIADPFIEVIILDDGLGLDSKNESRIFDPLFTTKDPKTNSGLGLTLAQQIVEEHLGSLTVSVGKDKRIQFKIRFPKSEVQS